MVIKQQTTSGASARSRDLSKAKSAKQDEFYTQLSDISDELRHYKAQLRGKTILCNCDDPYESNFFKYFALNFNTLGIKRLIATSYVKSPIVGEQLPLLDIEGLKPDGKEPYRPIAIADKAAEILFAKVRALTTAQRRREDFLSEAEQV